MFAAEFLDRLDALSNRSRHPVAPRFVGIIESPFRDDTLDRRHWGNATECADCDPTTPRTYRPPRITCQARPYRALCAMSVATVFANASPVVPAGNEVMWPNVLILVAVVVVAIYVVRAIVSACRKRQVSSAAVLNDSTSTMGDTHPTGAARG